jgi:hypothetical protein
VCACVPQCVCMCVCGRARTRRGARAGGPGLAQPTCCLSLTWSLARWLLRKFFLTAPPHAAGSRCTGYLAVQICGCAACAACTAGAANSLHYFGRCIICPNSITCWQFRSHKLSVSIPIFSRKNRIFLQTLNPNKKT